MSSTISQVETASGAISVPSGATEPVTIVITPPGGAAVTLTATADASGAYTTTYTATAVGTYTGVASVAAVDNGTTIFSAATSASASFTVAEGSTPRTITLTFNP